jgi:methylmalonyl-CoA mutase N-terminal domain/subunit
MVQAEVNRQAYEQERRQQAGETRKVGVNCFREEEEAREVEFHPYRVEEATAQIRRLERVRSERDDATVEALLGKVRDAASARENVMPSVMDAVEAYATVGEVCGVLKEVFGTYREPVRF